MCKGSLALYSPHLQWTITHSCCRRSGESERGVTLSLGSSQLDWDAVEVLLDDPDTFPLISPWGSHVQLSRDTFTRLVRQSAGLGVPARPRGIGCIAAPRRTCELHDGAPGSCCRLNSTCQQQH